MKCSLLFSLFLLLSACASKPYVVVQNNEDLRLTVQHKIYVVNHGWHTGFVVPTSEINARLPLLKKRFGNVPYLEFGWGDKGFYQASKITSGLTLRAIFWPTESVIHAVAVPEDVEHYFRHSEVATLCLSHRNYLALIQFISNSFYRTLKDKTIPTKTGIYGDSQFYTGVGNYTLMNTCNKWTAKGLKSAGLHINPTFKLTAGSIMRYLEKYPGSERLCS